MEIDPNALLSLLAEKQVEVTNLRSANRQQGETVSQLTQQLQETQQEVERLTGDGTSGT